jgi:hypothetical protein
MGCGIAKDADNNTIVVCQYTPKGNVLSTDLEYRFSTYIDNVKPIPWDMCNSLLVPDVVNWPPIDGEINITEEMCRRYHDKYIADGEAAGAKIRAEAAAWAEGTKAAAWEYSVKIKAEADAYKAKIQAEMQQWRLDYIAQIKLDISQKLIIDIVKAEDDAAA